MVSFINFIVILLIRTSPHLRHTQNNSFWHNWEMRYPAKVNFPDTWCSLLQARSIGLETHFGENFLKLIIQQFFSFLNKPYWWHVTFSEASGPFSQSVYCSVMYCRNDSIVLFIRRQCLPNARQFKDIVLLVWNGQVKYNYFLNLGGTESQDEWLVSN